MAPVKFFCFSKQKTKTPRFAEEFFYALSNGLRRFAIFQIPRYTTQIFEPAVYRLQCKLFRSLRKKRAYGN